MGFLEFYPQIMDPKTAERDGNLRWFPPEILPAITFEGLISLKILRDCDGVIPPKFNMELDNDGFQVRNLLFSRDFSSVLC